MYLSDVTGSLVVILLILLNSIYIRILFFSNDNSYLDNRVALPLESESQFEQLIFGIRNEFGGGNWEAFVGNDDAAKGFIDFNQFSQEELSKPNVPSSFFYNRQGFVVIKSNEELLYYWMYGLESGELAATASAYTPMELRLFEVVPVESSFLPSSNSSGWVLLRCVRMDKFLYVKSSGDDVTWTVKAGSLNAEEAMKDKDYRFLLEEEGFILNEGTMGFLTVFDEALSIVRTRSPNMKDLSADMVGLFDDAYLLKGGVDVHADIATEVYPAHRGGMSEVTFEFVTEKQIKKDSDQYLEMVREYEKADEEHRKMIGGFPVTAEKRVISFGLYGSNPKYITGAYENVKMAKTYFPGWICRFYVSSDVEPDVVDQLRTLGVVDGDRSAYNGKDNMVEIELKESGEAIEGMFWRFLVASDPSVDVYIIRDVDSRLNARDRIAVEEWLTEYKKSKRWIVHVMRDHVNQCLPMNGGMWGGVRDALPDMVKLVGNWSDKSSYADDLNFLGEVVWPMIKDYQYAHDAYCCEEYPNTHGFPTQRSLIFEHVGQVFNANNEARWSDIDGFTRFLSVPVTCRRSAEWIYG